MLVKRWGGWNMLVWISGHSLSQAISSLGANARIIFCLCCVLCAGARRHPAPFQTMGPHMVGPPLTLPCIWIVMRGIWGVIWFGVWALVVSFLPAFLVLVIVLLLSIWCQKVMKKISKILKKISKIYMQKNYQNFYSNIHFRPSELCGGGLGGLKRFLGESRGFFGSESVCFFLNALYWST